MRTQSVVVTLPGLVMAICVGGCHKKGSLAGDPLVGTWQAKYASATGNVDDTVTFRDDGTFTSHSTLTKAGQEAALVDDDTGTWKPTGKGHYDQHVNDISFSILGASAAATERGLKQLEAKKWDMIDADNASPDFSVTWHGADTFTGVLAAQSAEYHRAE